MIIREMVRVRLGGGNPTIVINEGDGWYMRQYSPRTSETYDAIYIGPNLEDLATKCRSLEKFRDTGPYAIDEMVSYQDEVYAVLGYFKRFIVLSSIMKQRVIILRKTSKEIYKHYII